MSRLFLLEDDISLIDGLLYSLNKNGFQIDVARSIKEAKKLLLETEKYDLLILDVTLPDGTGFDICEKVRKQNKGIPIIFLTASDEEVNIIRGLDCGGDDYVTKPFKLGELCSRIRALLRRAGISLQDQSGRLECGDISIDLQMILSGDGDEMVFCDRDWTSEAVGNLVKNALDHTEPGGLIRITWESTPLMLRIFVSDNGSGIAPEDIHHIFKRFYRSKSSLDTLGIGLGLPLAKSIIEGQGGVISVKSDLHRGTTFTASFPYKTVS